MALSATKVAASKVSGEDAKFNQNNVTISNNGLVYTLAGDTETLKSYAGGDGTHQYIAILIATGEPSIIGISDSNGYAFTQADVTEAASVGGAAGSIVYWAEADVLKNADRSFTLKKAGRADTTITFKWSET